jgi:hypothetical protein
MPTYCQLLAVGLGAPAHSVESFFGDEDTACFIAGIFVESVARRPFEQVLINFKHLVVSTLEVSTVGLIPQCFVADPTEHEASSLVGHPKLDPAPSNPMVIV